MQKNFETSEFVYLKKLSDMNKINLTDIDQGICFLLPNMWKNRTFYAFSLILTASREKLRILPIFREVTYLHKKTCI